MLLEAGLSEQVAMPDFLGSKFMCYRGIEREYRQYVLLKEPASDCAL